LPFNKLLSSFDFVTADNFGKNGWLFFWHLVLEFVSFLTVSGLDLAPWQKLDLATLLLPDRRMVRLIMEMVGNRSFHR